MKIEREDLKRLKASKPIPITAHTNELVVPVVYARQTKAYLERQGITLPLTPHQLAEMKKDAQSLAKGGTVKNKKKKKTKSSIIQKGLQNQINQQRVTVKIQPHQPQAPVYPSNNFESIRPYSTAPMMFIDPTPKEKDMYGKPFNDALDRYFKDKGVPIPTIPTQKPVRRPDSPLRNADFDENFDINAFRLNFPIVPQSPVSSGTSYDQSPSTQPSTQPSSAPVSSLGSPRPYRDEAGHPMSVVNRYGGQPIVRPADQPLRPASPDLIGNIRAGFGNFQAELDELRGRLIRYRTENERIRALP